MTNAVRKPDTFLAAYRETPFLIRFQKIVTEKKNK